jgi:Haem-binding domain
VLIVLAVASVLTRPTESTGANLPILAGARIDPSVKSIMERACLDCHSEQTHYPWYAYVAPVSWWIASDVSRGRLHLNLSRWSEYPLIRRERSLSEIANQVKDRDMPLPQYTLIHRDARLSDADVNAIFQWTQAERARLIEESLAGNR